MEKNVNVIVRFEVENQHAEILVALIKEFFRDEVSKVPGFIAAKLHTNIEQTVVINYATWESSGHFKNFITNVAMHSERSIKIREYNPQTDVVFGVSM